MHHLPDGRCQLFIDTDIVQGFHQEIDEVVAFKDAGHFIFIFDRAAHQVGVDDLDIVVGFIFIIADPAGVVKLSFIGYNLFFRFNDDLRRFFRFFFFLRLIYTFFDIQIKNRVFPDIKQRSDILK